MTNTQADIGIRRMIYTLTPPAYRNFEPGGTVQYNCNKGGMVIAGVTYQPGNALPLGVLPDDVLEVLFNQGDINPAS
ncbi:MAG: hypothetical protein ABSB88_07995 [Bryobacteraceae bacterium]